MVSSRQSRQRGEGKIGCLVSLLVLLAAGAIVYKLAPVIYGNSSLQKEAEDLAGRAGVIPVPTLDLQLRDKARDLEIPEALRPGAMTFTTQGDSSAGTCRVQLRYRRTVDFYGIYTLNLDTDKTISRPYMDAR